MQNQFLQPIPKWLAPGKDALKHSQHDRDENERAKYLVQEHAIQPSCPQRRGWSALGSWTADCRGPLAALRHVLQYRKLDPRRLRRSEVDCGRGQELLNPIDAGSLSRADQRHRRAQVASESGNIDASAA